MTRLSLFSVCSDTGGDIYGATPLKEAANYNKIECVELLIAAGADVNQGDRGTEFDENLLDFQSKNVEFTLGGASSIQIDEIFLGTGGETALMKAAQRGE